MFELIGAMLLGMAIIFSIIIASIVLWIWMIIDCAQRKFKKSDDKVIWILVLIFLGIIGAIIYYFVVKRNNKK